ncbi:hypothetical protein RND71_003374 [Anisodus tanguticus]|uniref:Uncharacterized protein n=1 Tax=Anisodus tanguticus TaxID=243964 RepID=A0AAE1VNM9_9SOLA|nr:hypothetical protein RND71_003374 [Anisodus tanguticus]
MGIRWFDKPRKNNHRLVLTLKRPALLKKIDAKALPWFARRKKDVASARDDKERASSIDEQQIDGALGIALFFSPFLSASSDPFVRNFFVCTEPLVESNPVPQDPISAIILLAFMPETSPVLWALAYVDQK